MNYQPETLLLLKKPPPLAVVVCKWHQNTEYFRTITDERNTNTICTD